MKNKDEVTNFLEVYSKAMAAENKYVSEMCWSAFKFIHELKTEINDLESQIEKLEKNGKTRKD